MKNIICLKWGTKYGPEYVNKLYNSCKRLCSFDFNFYCITENTFGLSADINTKPLIINEPGITGWWHKLSLFSCPLYDIVGTNLFLDLDLVLVNDLLPYFDFPGEFCAIEDFAPHDKMVWNSSIVKWEANKFGYIWDKFLEDPKSIMKTYPGDQDFISEIVPDIQTWPETWQLSYRWHSCWDGFEPDTKAIIFHGRPNPHEAISGYTSSQYITPPAPWLANFWR